MRKLFGVASGMAGVCLIVGAQALSGFGEQAVGAARDVAATVCYAARRLRQDVQGPRSDPAGRGSLVCGAAILLPASLVIDQPWTLIPSRDSMLALIGLSVFSTALALVIYFRLVHTLGSVGVTSQAYLRVPIGVVIGVLFLGEQLTFVTCSARMRCPRGGRHDCTRSCASLSCG